MKSVPLSLIVFIAIVVVVISLGYMSFSSIMKAPHTTTSTPTLIHIGSTEYVELIVVVDNYPNSKGELVNVWGLSILIRTPNHTILFDTGPDPEVLKHNLEVLGIDPRDIDCVVVSHEHGDHVDGLEYIAAARPGLKVYVPSGMSTYTKSWMRNLGLEVIEVSNTTVICDGIAIVGQLYGPPFEQALAVNVKGYGLVIVVGCSHPGVDRIVEKASRDLGTKPYLVIGGFHLAGTPTEELKHIVRNLLDLGIKYIAPIHCSGTGIRELLRHKYPEHYMECHVGSVVRIGK